LGQKRSKKAVKKVVVATVQRVPSTLSDEEMMDEPHRTCFFSCLCCELKFSVRRGCTPSSENDFVDIETFSDIVLEARATPDDSSSLASADAGISKTLVADDEASPKSNEDLEHTVNRSGDFLQDPALIGTRKDIPDEQDPTPFVAAYNESFGTSFRGDLLSVGG
jgi:hypothetical protein